MNNKEKYDTTVKIMTVPSREETKEENIDYIAVNFQNWDIYIWSCREFTPFLTSDEGSVVKGVTARFENHQDEKKDKANLSTEWKPMNERVKDFTEIKLKEMANHNLEELVEIIDLNRLEKQMKNGLRIEEEKFFDENESRGLFMSTKIMSEMPNPRSSFGSEIGIHFWSEGQIHESLLIKKKGQHLNEDQISFIAQLLHRSPGSRRYIQKLYKLSLATLKRISKSSNLSESFHSQFHVQIRKQKSISYEAKQLIRSYISPPWGPKYISMVKNQIKSELRETYSLHRIRDFVKKEMRFSYKKGSSRPQIYATQRTQLIKALFWTELLLLVAKGEVIINWDESSFDRSVKRQFSWLPKGKNLPIINDKLKGRASLILATWNTGEWIGMVVLGTVDSDKFWLFLGLLKTLIDSRNDSIEKSPIIIFDNARTHSSIKTINTIKDLSLPVRFLAPYCPEAAPIERIFGKIKSKLRVLGWTQNIDFSKKNGVEIIFSLVKSLTKESWLKAWTDVIKEARLSIIEILIKNNTEMSSH